MKTMSFKVAASLIVLAAVLVFGLTTAPAYAETSAGSALLFTYYDVRSIADGGLGLTDNYFTIINTAQSWVQAHIRIRTGDKSVELMDFDILLSPEDVFTFDLYESAQIPDPSDATKMISGGIEFASCDTDTLENSNFDVATSGARKGCVTMNSNTNTNLLDLIKLCQTLNATDALKATLKGYVEVIGEGAIDSRSKTYGDANKNYCDGDGSTAPLASTKKIPKSTLYSLNNDASCWKDKAAGTDPSVVSMGPVLHGRVYYATLANGKADRLASVNAEVLDNTLPVWAISNASSYDNGIETPGSSVADARGRRIILHADTFNKEKDRCKESGKNDAGCFAYTSASTKRDPTGANDMNSCFFLNSKDVSGDTTGVTNKYGAAMTFGPALVDLVYRRNGSLGGPVRQQQAGAPQSRALNSGLKMILNYLSNNYAMVASKQNMGHINNSTALAAGANKTSFANVITTNPSAKKYIESHYFNIPAQYEDITTKIAIIFPFQHYIGEENTIKFISIWNTTEYKSTDTGKFFSPGLPSAGNPGEEAQLHTLKSSAFAQGWFRLEPGVDENSTSATSCLPGSIECSGAAHEKFDTLVCSDNNYMRNADNTAWGAGGCTNSDYKNPPGYSGLVFNIGGGVLSATALSYGDGLDHSDPRTVKAFVQSEVTP